jgi:hypothetical protein
MWRRMGVVVVLAMVAGACSSASHGSSAAAPVPGGRNCLGPDAGTGRIAWSTLHNPILSYPQAGTKDEAVHLLHGKWYLLFSSVSEAPGAAASTPPHWSIGATTTTDFSRFSPLVLWPDQPGTLGMASPDITQRPDGMYVATTVSIPGEINGGQAKIYYRTSTDLVRWSPYRRLAANIHTTPGDRLIDPALAFLPTGGVILGYKINLDAGQQAFEIAYSASGSLDGPWAIVGRPDIKLYGDTVENYQFLQLDGQWRLVATSNTFDQPWLFTLGGPPANPASWLHWTGGYQLMVPNEAWEQGHGVTGSDYEHANSAYLCDARPIDGHYYLFFTGSPEMTTFGGSGHNALGVARSTDLIHWQVP